MQPDRNAALRLHLLRVLRQAALRQPFARLRAACRLLLRFKAHRKPAEALRHFDFVCLRPAPFRVRRVRKHGRQRDAAGFVPHALICRIWQSAQICVSVLIFAPYFKL